MDSWRQVSYLINYEVIAAGFDVDEWSHRLFSDGIFELN